MSTPFLTKSRQILSGIIVTALNDRSVYATLSFNLQMVSDMVIAEAAMKGSGSVFSLVIGAGPMVKFVLLVLLFLSVVSWAIIIHKYFQYKAAVNENESFSSFFWSGKSLDIIYKDTKQLSKSPLAAVFKGGFVELKKIRRMQDNPSSGDDAEDVEDESADIGSVDNIGRALRRASTQEMTRMERYLPFLATTGSTAPFVGLFGTVWGIMSSFQQMGVTGKVGLDVVAPGISEALIATAAGLAAAIPAVVGYNFFVSRVKEVAAEMDNFSADILNIIERHFLK